MYILWLSQWFSIQYGDCSFTCSAYNGKLISDYQSTTSGISDFSGCCLVFCCLWSYIFLPPEKRAPCADWFTERDFKSTIYKPTPGKKGKQSMKLLSVLLSSTTISTSSGDIDWLSLIFTLCLWTSDWFFSMFIFRNIMYIQSVKLTGLCNVNYY